MTDQHFTEGDVLLVRDFPGLETGPLSDYAGLRITFPANTSREDFERMKGEIQAAIDQAELRGEQKATEPLMAVMDIEGAMKPVTDAELRDIIAALLGLVDVIERIRGQEVRTAEMRKDWRKRHRQERRQVLTDGAECDKL